MMGIVFFLMRIAVLIVVLYFIYFFYKSLRKSPKEKPNKETTVFTCPSPKTFIDYTEGRIKGKKKKAIDRHITHCRNCQDALRGVFDMPKKEAPK
ncbi:MAG: hypothetical protein WBC74_02115 [Candidatus Omnitrophota bacterium]